MYKSLLVTALGIIFCWNVHGQSFTIADNEVCANSIVTAANTTPGGQPAEFLWSLIDVSTGIVQGSNDDNWGFFDANITREGNFSLCLRIGPVGSTQETCQTITGLGLPVPAFSAVPNSNICIGDDIQFTDQSTTSQGTSVVEWYWELEGATPQSAEIENPVFSFGEQATPGDKDLTLIIKDSKGCESSGETSIFKDEININIPPVPSFTIPPSTSCSVPYTVTLNNTTPSEPGLTYFWELSTGQTSTDEDPTFTINTSDDIDVKLTVSNGTCEREEEELNGLSATSLGVEILTSIDEGCPPLVVVVGADNSIGGLDYNWAFPGSDLPMSNSKNNTIAYNTPGTYTITLTASKDGCSDVKTKTITVTDAPVANFTVNDPASCNSPHSITVTNSSTGSTNCNWDFPGGNPRNSNNCDPGNISYATGEYAITLIASTDNGCSDTLTIDPAVAVGSPLVKVLADPKQGCVGDIANFAVDVDVPDGVTMGTPIWDFDHDNQTGSGTSVSHQFPDGEFNVCVTVPFNGNGCMDVTRCVRMRRGGPPGKPTGTIPSEVCVGESFVFQCNNPGPGISCYWKPGDNTTVQGCSPGYNYSDPNVGLGFQVELVCSQNGCKDSSVIGNIVVIPPQANMDLKPVCGSLTQFEFCDESQFAEKSYFIYSVNNGPKQRLDGPTSPLACRQFEFAADAPGFVDVKIVALRTDNGCRDSLSRKIILPDPLTDPLVRPTNGCVGTTVVFKDSLAPSEAQDVFNQNIRTGNRIVAWNWILNQIWILQHLRLQPELVKMLNIRIQKEDNSRPA